MFLLQDFISCFRFELCYAAKKGLIPLFLADPKPQPALEGHHARALRLGNGQVVARHFLDELALGAEHHSLPARDRRLRDVDRHKPHCKRQVSRHAV